jgi:eukaryotic-like serine/threonine-protein kinase
MKCLEKDRTRRYETANGLAADIQRHLEHEPVVARPPSTWYRVQKFARRNKVMVIAGVAVGTALLAGIAVSTWQAREARIAQREAEEARAGEQAQLRQTQSALKEAEAARAQAQARGLEARRQAYAADMNHAQQALAADDLGRARRLLDAYRPRPDEAGDLDLRGWEWRHLWQQCRNDALGELCHDSNAVHAVAISPDGRLLAVAGLLPEYADLWDVRTRKKIATLPAQACHPVTFSPRGDVLATAGPDQGEVRLYRAGSTNLLGTYHLDPADKQIVVLKFSPDGHLLAALSDSRDRNRPGGITVWDLNQQGGLWQSPVSVVGGLICALDFSSDGQWLAIGDAAGELRVVEARTGAARFQFTAHAEGITSVAWSPTGPILATGSGYFGGQIRLWDANAGKAIGPLEGHTSWISELIFSGDGQRLYSASADQTIRIWDVPQRRCLARLRGSTDELYGLALSPDGKTLVSASKDGVVALWSADPRQEEEQPWVLPKGNEATYAFAADSRSLAAAADGRVTLFRLPDLRHGQLIPELGTNVCTLAYSSDGGRLAGGCTDGMVRVWSCVEQRLVQSFSASEHKIFSVRFLEDSDRLFSVDGTPNVIEWDTRGRAVERRLFADANTLALAPNGRFLVWGDLLGAVHWWDFEAGEALGSRLTHRSAVVAVAVTQDSSKVATVGNDASVAVWDASVRVPIIPPFKGHMHGAHGVAFSPDGRRLATTGESVKLWDLTSFRELATLTGHGPIFRHVAFSSDGNWVAACSSRGQLHLWHAPSWEDIAAAETKKAEPQ